MERWSGNYGSNKEGIGSWGWISGCEYRMSAEEAMGDWVMGWMMGKGRE